MEYPMRDAFNGDVIDTPRDSDGRKDLTLRFQASYLLGGQGPNAKTSAHLCAAEWIEIVRHAALRAGARRRGTQVSARKLPCFG